MHRLLLVAGMLGPSAHMASADEFVIIGRFEEITQLPEGTNRCKPVCPAGAHSIGKDGREGFCISNSCGCGEIRISVERVLVGKSAGAVATARYRLSEWCAPEFPAFPVTHQRILARIADDGRHASSMLYPTPDGDDEFDTDGLTRVGTVDIGSLKAQNGRAPLAELVRRLSRK